jgi:predicted DNA-binding transcriptional regulator YafY
MSTSRICRIIRIITTLQTGRTYDADKLADFYQVSKRTILRDLKEIKKVGIPCSYYKCKHTYSIKPEFFLPPLALSTEEALGLLLLAYESHKIFEQPLRKQVLSAALKIESNLPKEIQRYCNMALPHISIKANECERTGQLDKSFEKILTSILQKRVLKVHYQTPEEKVVTELEPYHLIYHTNGWHLLGKPTHRKEIYSFNLKNIKELNVLDKCYVENMLSDVSDYFGRAWSTAPEGQLYNVKLKFTSKVARRVAETQWHKTQVVSFEEDGSATAEFRVDGLNEIKWWILSFGDQVQVLAPRILRQQIIQIAQNTVQKNEQLSLVKRF